MNLLALVINPNMDVDEPCDFEEGDCGFIATGDSALVSWLITSRSEMGSGDMQLGELTPDIDSTYHSSGGKAENRLFSSFSSFLDNTKRNVFSLINHAC